MKFLKVSVLAILVASSLASVLVSTPALAQVQVCPPDYPVGMSCLPVPRNTSYIVVETGFRGKLRIVYMSEFGTPVGVVADVDIPSIQNLIKGKDYAIDSRGNQYPIERVEKGRM